MDPIKAGAGAYSSAHGMGMIHCIHLPSTKGQPGLLTMGLQQQPIVVIEQVCPCTSTF
jgi:hypothetical protein